MMPDDPTPEDRMELREAFDAASEFLHNEKRHPVGDTADGSEKNDLSK